MVPESDAARSVASTHTTPSTSFRHLPPWRKDVVNQCLEFGFYPARFQQNHSAWTLKILQPHYCCCCCCCCCCVGSCRPRACRSWQWPSAATAASGPSRGTVSAGRKKRARREAAETYARDYAAAESNSKHWFTTSFLQPLPYLVTP